jgi:2'-5' RNA ligase
MKHSQGEGQNLFTLVSYTPEPLRRWISRLRKTLPVAAGSQPHITILPPRPLTIAMEEAKEKLTATLAHWKSFEIELSGVRVFPNTAFLYLEVSHGSSTLSRLHAELNAGEFAHEEVFEFHPHVTIGGPVPQEDLERIQQKAAEAWQNSHRPCRFSIKEIAFVSIAAEGKHGDWRRMWAHKLARPKTHTQTARALVTSQTF